MRKPSVALLCFLATIGQAQDITPIEARMLGRILDTDCIYISGTTECERLVLLRSETHTDTADLIILSSERETPPIVIRDVVYSGHLADSFPFIEYRETGGFVLRSEQTGHGPHPWMQSLMVVPINGTLVVAEYEFYSFDRIQNDIYSCDINLLSGEFSSEAVLFDPGSDFETIHWRGDTGPALNIALADWPTSQSELTHCVLEADLYYNH